MAVSKIGHNIDHKLANLTTPSCAFLQQIYWVSWKLLLSRIKLNSYNKIFNDSESIIISLINSKYIWCFEQSIAAYILLIKNN